LCSILGLSNHHDVAPIFVTSKRIEYKPSNLDHLENIEKLMMK